MHVEARWMRGGTSKCWVFEDRALETTGIPLDDLLPRLFGSPDLRQLDGVGGASSTTSKAVILHRNDRPGIDVSFTFAQVGIEEALVDWGSNCGNCSSTVGLYAVEEGWVPITGEVTTVTTYNVNTGQTILQRIPTPGGSLDGSPGADMPGSVFPGHEIGLGFLDPEGRTTGMKLPAGSPRTVLQAGGRRVEATLVDAGAPLVVLPAGEFVPTASTPAEWSVQVLPHLAVLDELRRAGAVAMGMAGSPDEAERAVPKLGLVGASPEDDADLQILMLSMGRPHPAMPITGSVALTTAARTPGSVAAELAPGGLSERLRLRTPAGIVTTFTEHADRATSVGVHRTARTLAKAQLPIPRESLDLRGAREEVEA
jgi:2-methylaconitate cis-trans-isomerase PrpF